MLLKSNPNIVISDNNTDADIIVTLRLLNGCSHLCKRLCKRINYEQTCIVVIHHKDCCVILTNSINSSKHEIFMKDYDEIFIALLGTIILEAI